METDILKVPTIRDKKGFSLILGDTHGNGNIGIGSGAGKAITGNNNTQTGTRGNQWQQ